MVVFLVWLYEVDGYEILSVKQYIRRGFFLCLIVFQAVMDVLMLDMILHCSMIIGVDAFTLTLSVDIKSPIPS